MTPLKIKVQIPWNNNNQWLLESIDLFKQKVEMNTQKLIKYNFTNPETKAQTNNIERKWKDAKRGVLQFGRSKHHFIGYLALVRFMKHPETNKHLHQFVHASAELHPSILLNQVFTYSYFTQNIQYTEGAEFLVGKYGNQMGVWGQSPRVGRLWFLQLLASKTQWLKGGPEAQPHG